MRRGLLLLLPLLAHGAAHAQDNQYWTQQQGSRATLLGGASMAAITDNSAFYSDPALLAFLKDPSITVTADYYYAQHVRTRDLDGLGLDMVSSQYNGVPRMVAASFPLKKGGPWMLGLGLVNTQYSEFTFEEQAAKVEEVNGQPDVTHLRQSIISLRDRTREDMGGVSISRRLSERQGIGLTVLGSYHVQDHDMSVDSDVLDADTNNANGLLATWSLAEHTAMRSAGLLCKLGWSYRGDHLRVAFTLTTPRLQMHPFGDGLYFLSALGLPQADSATYRYVVYGTGLLTTWRSPWIVDGAVERDLGKTRLFLRAAWFSAVPLYTVMHVSPEDDLSGGRLLPPDDRYTSLVNARRSLVNVAAGAAVPINKTVDLLMGARTDFNFLDRGAFDRGSVMRPTYSYWDLYHLSAGVDLHNDRIQATIGLVYSFGSSNDALQDPNDFFPELPADEDITLRTTFDQFGISFGFNYFFLGPGIGGTKTP